MKMIKFRGIFSRKKKLRATTRRATASGADFDDLSEPNMKLSRALLIVLLLHVVAVAGIIAFNAIKSRQGGLPVVSSSHVTKTASNPEDVKETPSSPAKSSKKAKENDSIPDGGKVYIVRKRDNPVTIAKKFKVSYDDLLAANHIDDPHKLKVGQKLIIPAKGSKPKKATE
ncbi:MAG: LysM domain-containing protein [Chthoniobacterales bacterium]|jgi:LysM repeat protein|nr:LysM domain-containing protein [Chthoniobacterales bacterium]